MIVIDAAIPVCPTVTDVGKVGPTERIAPAATGLDGITPTPITTASTTAEIAHRRRSENRRRIGLPPISTRPRDRSPGKETD